MEISDEALGSMIQMALQASEIKEALKHFKFPTMEITIRVAKDDQVPGGIVIAAVNTKQADALNLLGLWLHSGDTGTSSMAIFNVLSGTNPKPTADGFGDNWPHDNSDFGRCHRLLQRFPDWRPRLGEVMTAFPAWAPMVKAWADLEALYEEEKDLRLGHKLYARMQELGKECYAILNQDQPA